jgi:hypothetical protein
MAQIDLFHLLFPQRVTSYGTMSSIAAPDPSAILLSLLVAKQYTQST